MTALHLSTCATCGCERVTQRKPRSDRCRSCITKAQHPRRSPESYAASAAKLRARLACPVEREIHRQRTAAGTRAALQRPEMMELRRELGRRVGATRTGQNRFPAGSPERLAAARVQAATKMAWCPIEYRPAYRQLVDVKRMRAAEARAIIEAQIAADLARYARTGRLQVHEREAA